MRPLNCKPVVVATLVLGLTLWGGTFAFGLDAKTIPESMANRMQTPVRTHREELVSGTTLYKQTAIFNRHGPAKSKIAEIPFALPEMTVREVWYGPVDSKGVFADHSARVEDIDGLVVQEIDRIGNELIYTDTRHNKQQRTSWRPLNVDEYLEGITNTAQRLLNEGWRLAPNGVLDGMETLVLEDLTSAPDLPSQDGMTGVNIPYTLDLQISGVLQRIEIALDNPLLTRDQTWIIDGQGNKVLIRERRVSLVELLR